MILETKLINLDNKPIKVNKNHHQNPLIKT